MISKLTPTQHAVLAYAIEHTDGKIEWLPKNIKGGARQKVLDGLLNRALITKDGEGWRVTVGGYDALGVVRPESLVAPETATAPSAADPDLEGAVASLEGQWAKERTAAAVPSKMRSGTKQATIIEMLSRPEGATIAQIMDATGWQAHTVRGTLAGALKKRLGLAVVSTKTAGGERVYRVSP